MAVMTWPKKRKYRNQPVMVDGIRFASKKEAKRYQELRLLLSSGHIENLKLQPRFRLHAGITYVGDFSYNEPGSERLIVEDTKGFKTPEYKLKKKLFLHCYPEIDFREL